MWKGFLWLLLAALWLLNVRPLRKALITRPFMKTYLKLLPTDVADREARRSRRARCGGTGSCSPARRAGRSCSPRSPPQLSPRSRPSSTARARSCAGMLDDWNITHERGDLPPQVWEFLKSRGFFAMIIPKKYGGLEFSAYAHSCVLAKIASRSATASSTVAVPNSLGPAELLNHYGTEEQKNYYLPRLARGEEVPCFALTGPRAGSDAGSIPDTGIVCRGTWQGREIARPEAQLLQALHHARAGRDRHRPRLPHVRPGQAARRARPTSASPARSSRATPRASRIGRRHFPLNIPFQNGPDPGQGRVRAARLHHRRPEDGRQRLAHAGRAALGRPLHLAALQRHRRRQGGRVGHRRLRAHPQPVQHAGRPASRASRR